MKYFVILSQGAYSDYCPNYYYGDNEITKEQFNKKGEEVGDKLIEEYLSLPERKDTSGRYWNDGEKERFNPITNKTVYKPNSRIFIEIMEKWLIEEMNYKKVEECPEINCCYDIPTSKKYQYGT